MRKRTAAVAARSIIILLIVLSSVKSAASSQLTGESVTRLPSRVKLITDGGNLPILN